MSLRGLERFTNRAFSREYLYTYRVLPDSAHILTLSEPLSMIHNKKMVDRHHHTGIKGLK